MTNNVLNLPEDLKDRRRVLETELRATVKELISVELKRELFDLINSQGIVLDDKPTKITWEFHPESDDEGGTDWWISYVQLHGENDLIDAEEITFMKKYSWSGNEYEASLDEEIREILTDWRDDLYRHGVEEILL